MIEAAGSDSVDAERPAGLRMVRPNAATGTSQSARVAHPGRDPEHLLTYPQFFAFLSARALADWSHFELDLAGWTLAHMTRASSRPVASLRIGVPKSLL